MKFSVVAYGKSVGFGIDSEQKIFICQAEFGERKRLFTMGNYKQVAQVLVVFGNTDDGDFYIHFFEGGEGGTDLTLAPINQYQIGKRPFGMIETAFDDLAEHGGVIWT